MQRLTLVRYAIKPEHIAENEALTLAVFDELRSTAPEGILYGLYKEADGAGFVHLFANLCRDDSEAVTGLPAFSAYQADLMERCLAPPEVTRLSLDLLESYGPVSR